MTETEISLERKLKILADAAKYDVACTSSGSSRRGKKGILGGTGEGVSVCITLLKIFPLAHSVSAPAVTSIS